MRAHYSPPRRAKGLYHLTFEKKKTFMRMVKVLSNCPMENAFDVPFSLWISFGKRIWMRVYNNFVSTSIWTSKRVFFIAYGKRTKTYFSEKKGFPNLCERAQNCLL